MPPPIISKPPGVKPPPSLAPATMKKSGDKIIFSATEGYGKTTLAAFSPKPAILMARGETGYQTLYTRGLVPQADCVLLENWSDTMATLKQLRTACPYQTVVLDAIGGFERLCHESVCSRLFDSDWGPSGFCNFQKGYESSLLDWSQFLGHLEAISELGVTILALAHVKIKPFTPPGQTEGYSRYVADMHEKTWGITHKWADAAFFGNYQLTLVGSKGKKVAAPQNVRMVYVSRSAEYDAKNRFNLTEPFQLPSDPKESWNAFSAAINGNAPTPTLTPEPADEIPG